MHMPASLCWIWKHTSAPWFFFKCMLWKWQQYPRQQSFVPTKPSVSLTSGSDTRGAGYRQGLDSCMLALLHYRSQVVQPSLHSRRKILFKWMSGPWVLQDPAAKEVCALLGLEETLLSIMLEFSHWRWNWGPSWGSAAVHCASCGDHWIPRTLPHW